MTFTFKKAERKKSKLKLAIFPRLLKRSGNNRLIAAAPDMYDALKLAKESHLIMIPHHEDICGLCKKID